ncbi:unnamed protein product [Tilletia controversa]|uniref:DUS-like FMN-binding domain-containing protein n=3 Tax=Tilletia TaxID=13289 RepID=A0A8X7MPC3_9BASI|nr:hypothetical protein CF336_g4326 [Tilletia laevis]KAE8243337.1 hypothetical protein A4X06_0g6391 [Tilletia controversa]KAE8256634.1 hypothetical protein A4X03_0g5210 [Tilletia caries]KAE8199875.1 hypothetical protein CF335_g4067 [Tilletia laevis]CAD6885084.1 unnamed protein product [Tilletia caries]
MGTDTANPPPAKRQRRGHAPPADTALEHEGGQEQGKKKKERVMPTFHSPAYEAALALALALPLPQCPTPPNYAQGLFLAPMVRIGTLPTRLLSLRNGASLVWSPEIVDRAIIAATRTVHPHTGLVDFTNPEGRSVFSTHPVERTRLVFQLGSAVPAQAYEAIKVVAGDVVGVDLNCGCPKSFSTSGGMGANLLTNPDILCAVLRAMRHAAPPHVAVTCKIRLLPTQEESIKLVRQIVRTGVVNAITIHCRTKEMRPREPALLGRFREVAEAVREESAGEVPVVVNGDCWSAEDEARFLELTGATSIMIARGAELNPSVFRRQGKLSVPDIIAPQYARYAMYFDNVWGNTKYCLGQLNFKDRANIEHAPPTTTDPSSGTATAVKHMKKADLIALRDTVMKSTCYADLARAFGLDLEAECAKSQEEMLVEVREAVDLLNSRDDAASKAAKEPES